MRSARFNIVLFIILTIIFCVITFITLLAAAAEDEGTNGNYPVWHILANLFYIFRFPTHTLFRDFVSSGHPLFLGGLIFNGMFYAFITERIVSFITTK